MRTTKVRALVVLAAFLIASRLFAQSSEQPAYLNTSLPAEQRAADLVHRMTVEEKVTQLTNQSRAIPRLNVPAYNWWSEALHGVASSGTTEFPEPVGLAATFDTDAIHRMAIAIGTEGRIKRVQFERAGHSHAQEGLDFWAPNINIFRDPRWGRGQETYGEDPFLTARMGVAFVTGMQGDDPKYYRVHLDPETLCRAQRTGADAPHSRRESQQARRIGHLPAGVPRDRDRRQSRLGDVRLQQRQRAAGVRQRVSAAGPVARQMEFPRLRGVGLRGGHQYLSRPPLHEDAARGLRVGDSARHGQRVLKLLRISRTIATTGHTSRLTSKAF